MRTPHKCPLCEGWGTKGPQAQDGKCKACDGTGLLWSGYDDFGGAPVVNPTPVWPYPPYAPTFWWQYPSVICGTGCGYTISVLTGGTNG